ncbi:hypothetical protein F7725_017987 [Dissostichus mawsoni]|uniref:Protein kinase domain-containing protein n=1 Tax=Dissostichus mawsoni TaxID=36200 RepID=A0A7J5XQE2_DISMA|nr:hypothetical protein F7725_017987 [Dissostichus mawsoni]
MDGDGEICCLFMELYVCLWTSVRPLTGNRCVAAVMATLQLLPVAVFALLVALVEYWRGRWSLVSCRISFPQWIRIPSGRLAQTALLGSGWYPGSPCRRARAGVRPQLSAPLLPRRSKMDHLEGPLGPRVGHVMHLSGMPVYLNDSTYDGSTEQGMQFGGLGQLCDGVLGGDDFMQTKELRVWPGYDYLGWSREALGQGSVDIEFDFEKPRVFNNMQVHSNNRHTQGVRVFSKVECLFKPSILQPWSAALTLPPFDKDVTETDSYPPNPPKVPSTSSSAPPVNLTSSSPTSNSSNSTSDASEPLPTNSFMTNTTGNWTLSGFGGNTPREGLPVAKDDSSNTAILIGCLVGIILLLLAVIAVILWRQYWKKILGKAQGSLAVLLLNNPAYHLLLSDHRKGCTPVPNTSQAQEKSLNVPQACGSDMDMEKGFPPTQEEPPPYPGSPPYPSLSPPVSPPLPPSVPHYAEADIVSLQGVSGNNTYAVHLCEIENPQDFPTLEFPFNVRKGRPLLVAVKILRPDASKNARFVKILSRLKDPNIIRLLGVCVSSDPLCMVTEYMECGDLNHYPALISMASQIASGMKFLASLNFVHRDLATRNSLVGGRRGKFTTASDVWAFGVTLWEMLSVCQEQPYSNLTDEQVIDNAGEFFRDQGRQVYLSRPAVCPQGLYELMLSCWNRDCKLRPSFTDIHSFLTEDAMNMV